MTISSTTVVWRSGRQLASAVREARDRLGMTQSQLARRAGVGLKFLYELESGKDTLRADKVLDVLGALALQLVIAPRIAQETPSATTRAAMLEARQVRARYSSADDHVARRPDYVSMACIAAGVSLRRMLAPRELVRALLSGRPTPGKHAHFIVLLEEAPDALLRGLVAQVGALATPGRIAANLGKIAAALGVRLRAANWPAAA